MLLRVTRLCCLFGLSISLPSDTRNRVLRIYKQLYSIRLFEWTLLIGKEVHKDPFRLFSFFYSEAYCEAFFPHGNVHCLLIFTLGNLLKITTTL